MAEVVAETNGLRFHVSEVSMAFRRRRRSRFGRRGRRRFGKRGRRRRGIRQRIGFRL